MGSLLAGSLPAGSLLAGSLLAGWALAGWALAGWLLAGWLLVGSPAEAVAWGGAAWSSEVPSERTAVGAGHGHGVVAARRAIADIGMASQPGRLRAS